MKKFTIGAEQYQEELLALLQQACADLEQRGVKLAGEVAARGRYTFYTYRIIGTRAGQDDEVTVPAMRALAEAAAQFITGVWERYELQRIVASDFYYYAEDEVQYLADSSVQMLSDLSGPDGRPLRTSHIAETVMEQLAASGELLIEGLLRFRMQSMQADLHRVVEQAIDEYLMDLEYQEFVKLLRYFLEAQDPQTALLHMVCCADEEIRLFNEEGRPVAWGEADASLSGLSVMQKGVLVEDTISSLIALAPERLHIHIVTEAMPPVIETVQKVFGDRAVICRGCPLCHSAPYLPNYAEVREQNRQ